MRGKWLSRARLLPPRHFPLHSDAVKSRWENSSRLRVGFLDVTDFLTVYTGELMQLKLRVVGSPPQGVDTGSTGALIIEFPVNGDEVSLPMKVISLVKGPPPVAEIELSPVTDSVRAGIELYMTGVLRGETPPVRFRKTEVTACEDEFDRSLLEEDETGDSSTREKKSLTLSERIKEMTVLEKMKLAMMGSRDARSILFRDHHASTLMPYLLKNQRITLEEIGRIAGDPTAAPEAIRLISHNTGWMRDNGIRGKIIRNPKTNPDLAIQMLKLLPPGEIRVIAESTTVRGALQKAARQILKDRGVIR